MPQCWKHDASGRGVSSRHEGVVRFAGLGGACGGQGVPMCWNRAAPVRHLRAGLRRSNVLPNLGFVLALMAFGVGAGAAPLSPEVPQDYFPIGVFYQPSVAVATTSFAGWKGRGVHTLVGWEQQSYGVSIGDYTAAAANAGRYL